jgi:hypothetical protein
LGGIVMSFVDVWTILAGAASIISLLVVMSDKFPKWKKYITPIGFILGGFALGRVSAVALPAATRSVLDTRFTGFLLILILIFGVIIIIFRMLDEKFRNDWYLIFILFMIISMGIPALLDKYSLSFPDVPKEDYLLLANVKEDRADLAGAVKYLEKYKSLVSDPQLKIQVENKILSIQNKELSIK